MHSFLEVFKRRIAITLSRGTSALEPIHVPKVKEKVVKTFDVTPQQPSSFDLEHLTITTKKQWLEYGEEGLKKLSSRQLNHLPWVLYYGQAPKIASNPELTKAILSSMRKRGTQNLVKLIHAYLTFFDPMVPGTDLVRQYIATSLAEYSGSAPWITRWKKRTFPLFAQDGPLHTAKWLITKGTSCPAALSVDLGLDGELASGSFAKHVVHRVIELTETTFPTGLEAAIALLHGGTRFPELVPEAASRFIPKAGLECPSEIQDVLRPFFLRRMGDPRLPGNRSWWGKVSSEARQIFIQWISKRDLEFFFSIVDRSSKDPKWVYRRLFWEAYLPYIENTWVALGSRARDLVDSPQMREHLESRQFGSLQGAESSQSVFFVEMRGYLLVEWSHSGGCRIFRQQDGIERRLVLGRRIYSASQIRRDDYVHYLRHVGAERYSWQNDLAQWIMLNLGIKPSKSYQL